MAPANDRGLRRDVLIAHPAFIFALIFTALFLLHGPLLRLPYFWDEAGYFVPAAYDIYTSGDLIPHSTLSNAHPPLVMLWLAAWWKLSAFTPAVTRVAMLLIAAFALLGVYRLASRVANVKVAVATVFCTALYPVFFAQSSLAHLDLAAAAFTLWGLAMYVERRRAFAIVFFSLAALGKETAIVTPVALLAWELACPLLSRVNWLRRGVDEPVCLEREPLTRTVALLLACVPLAVWYAFHFYRTGYIFGNPEFVAYNVAATLSPVRIVLALFTRLWHVLAYMNLFVLTLAAFFAMDRPALRDDGVERKRIAVNVQYMFLVLIVAHVIEFAVLGGAALARYMLPVIPLVILVCVSTLYRRVRKWMLWVAIACAAFVLALFVNPPFHFAPEDNIAYADYVALHKSAASVLSQRYVGKRVLTAWPANDELTKPFLGYVKWPFEIVRIENFAAEHLLGAAQHREAYEVALVFSTKYEPRTSLFQRLPFWQRIQERYFDYHRDLPPAAAADILQGKIVWHQRRGRQWIAIIAVEHVENAGLRRPQLAIRHSQRQQIRP
jgi:hypothetical protein